MSITERAAIVLQEIDAALAMAEKATPGPWQADPEESVYNASVRCGISDPWTGDCVASVLKEQDAPFIAASRTILPSSLRCLKTAIEGLLLIHLSPFLDATEIGEIAQGDADSALSTLCDQWEVPA